MDNAPDEEATEFLEPVEELVDGDEQDVEHEEVLEEIVHEDEMLQMYDTDGRLIQYQNVVMYEDGSEVIEEYVEVEDLGNGEYAYVMTDEHGNRRLLKPDEVDAVKKEMPMLVEEMDEQQKDDEPGPSSSSGYSNKARGRFPGAKSSVQKQGMLGKDGRGGMMYMDRGYHYHESPTKRIGDMAKVDVEKYVPTVTVNRRPLPDNPDFTKPKQQRSRKNPPWQDEETSTSRSRPTRTPSPILIKETIFPAEDDDMLVRFKCHECDQGFPIIDRLCDHMTKNHDCQTMLREIEFFNERDFETFLFKIEKQSLGKEADPKKTFTQSRKSRNNVSQLFVCNYMSKKKKKFPELVEVGMASLVDRPVDSCTAFVQKTHNYECIRVKYCDQHVHNDGNVGFRVPITVKRRLFEMALKRLPIPCMQVILAHEVASLLPYPTRFAEKLKHLSHVEIVEVLQLISASLKTQENSVYVQGRRVPVRFETTASPDGQETLVVVRAHSPERPAISEHRAHPLSFPMDGEDVPMMAREEEVQEEEDDPIPPDASGGVMDSNMLYDPLNHNDPRFDELTEVELGILEAYERDIAIQLTDDQRKERNRFRAKFQLNKVVGLYHSLDAATHGLVANDMHMDTINKLRDMASYVVELVCTLDAEIKAQFNPALSVDDIRKDMIAGIAMQERVYQPTRRRINNMAQAPSPIKAFQQRAPPMPRSHEEYTERILSKVKALQPPHRTVGINSTGTFQLSPAERLATIRQLHRPENDKHLSPLRQDYESAEEQIPEEQKPSTSGLPPVQPVQPLPPLPEAYKAMPWSKPTRRRQPADPNAPAKKRGRPNKKTEAAAPVEEEEITSGALEFSQVPRATVVPRDPPALESATSSESSAPVPSGQASQDSQEIAAPSEDVPRTQPPAEAAVIPKSEPSTFSPQKAAVPVTIEREVSMPETPVTAASTPSSTAPDDTSSAPPTPATKTRTGRVVKPKKWGDE